MYKNVVRALMVGRFQPFHNGHLSLVQQIFEECDELIIAIGSAQFNYIYKDPFTAGERILMIHASLVDSGIDLSKCYIIPVVNDENNARWFAHLKSMVPHFNVLYSGNEFVMTITSESTIKQPNFVNKNEYNGTNIRKLMVTSRNWKKLVPNAVFLIIEKINGVKRVRTLFESDSDPQRW